MIKRRHFITLLGGAAAAWPLAARAQQDGRVRRVGVLDGAADGERDPRLRTNLAAFREMLAKLGWVEERNVRIDLRAGGSDPDLIRNAAEELISLAPDVVVASTGQAIRAARQQTQSTPIVFAGAGGDPVEAGLVTSIARPQGNITGFTNLYYSISGKWMELLKEVAPRTTRIAFIFNPGVNLLIAQGGGYAAPAQEAAPGLAVQLIPTPARDALELVRKIDGLVTEQNAGLLVLPPGPAGRDRSLLIRLAAQHQLPAIYPDRSWVTDGGLMSYGSISADLYRGAATYVDRLLRGAKVSDLPVQFPTKFELVVNLKTAKAIGLTIPEAFLLRADEVIE